MPTIVAVVGERRDDPGLLLLLGANGQHDADRLVDGRTTPATPDASWTRGRHAPTLDELRSPRRLPAPRSQPVPNLGSLAYDQSKRAAGWRQQTAEEALMTRWEQTFGMASVSNLVTAAAIGLLLAQGVIHLSEAPAQYAEVPYLGVLFVLTLAGALVAALGMARGMTWGWLLGLATTAGPLLGYVLSRSVGIPGVHETGLASIFEPLGVACVVAEAFFVLIAARVLLRGSIQVARVPARAVAN